MVSFAKVARHGVAVGGHAPLLVAAGDVGCGEEGFDGLWLNLLVVCVCVEVAWCCDDVGRLEGVWFGLLWWFEVIFVAGVSLKGILYFFWSLGTKTNTAWGLFLEWNHLVGESPLILYHRRLRFSALFPLLALFLLFVFKLNHF